MEDGWPENMDEWYEYIQSLEPSKLHDKAYAVNGMKFVEMLQEEEYTPQEIEDILFWFAYRLDEEEITFVPNQGGFYCSYQEILERGKEGE